MIFTSLENTREERIEQLKRLKTALQAVLELRNESEKQDEKVGLKEHAHKKPNQLSGGQMQRRTRMSRRTNTVMSRRTNIRCTNNHREKEEPIKILMYVR